MKKNFLTVAMLFAGGYVLAQNSVSTLHETGDYNTAVITQAGTHTSNVLQKSNAVSNTDGNLATITQSNITAYNIYGNDSKVEQHGNSHITTVIQIGDNALEAYIGSDGNNIDQNTDNETYARQNGEGNVGKQYIRGGTATKTLLTLNQGSKNNNSVQTASWAKLSKGAVDQGGNNNDSWQQIDGTSNEAHTTQLGVSNYSFQWIENGGSADNYNKVTQAGNYNTSRVLTTGDDNTFDLSQIGSNNVSVGKTGNIYSNAEQNGDRNSTTLTQSGNNNEVWLEQKGDDNSITGFSFVGGLQLGNYNKSIFSQNGDENSIISDQLGHHNYEKVTQAGVGQISNTRQMGDANIGNIAQANF